MPARMSGESTEPPRSFDGPATSARCGSHSTMRAPMPDELVDEEEPRLEHLLVDENEPRALRRRHERDRHRVGGERRPRLILELRHVSAEIALNHLLLLGRHDEIGPVDHARNAESREAHQRRAKMLDAGVGDANLRARDRRQADERPDLDVIGPDAMRRAAERAAALHRQLVRPGALDLCAERDEEMAEILDVRLARGIAKNRRSARRDSGHERVLGAGDARLIEKHVGAAKARRREVKVFVQLERRAEPLEREKVRVHAPAANDVAARRRQLNLAAAREHRRREQDRRADLPAELRIEARRHDASSRGC